MPSRFFRVVEYALVVAMGHLAGRSHSLAKWGVYRGWLHAKAGDCLLAVAYARMAIHTDPTWADGYRTLGYSREQCGDAAGARGAYQQGVQVSPQDVELWYRLGALEAKEEHFEQAEEAFRSAVEMRPDDPSLLASLAHVVQVQGRYQESADLLRRALSHGSEGPYAAYIELLLGKALSLLGQDRAALPLLLRSLEREPESAEAHHSLAIALGALGRWPEANEHAKRAVALDPRDERIRDFAATAQRHL